MKTKNQKRNLILAATSILMAGVLLVTLTSTVSAKGPGGNGNAGGLNGGGIGIGSSTAGTGLALTPLSADEADALTRAILEEYSALNLYQSVINQFGSVYPFSTIAIAEQQHVNALIRQADKYGVAVLANPGIDASISFNTIGEACAAGVDAEIADAALYDDLKTVTTHSDLLRVYDALQNASLNSHLPAFEACAY